MYMPLILKTQEVPFDSPDSCNRFRPSTEKPFVATVAAIEAHRQETIIRCLGILQQQADMHDGIDHLQIFRNSEPNEPDLWFIEDGEDGAITALLPSDY